MYVPLSEQQRDEIRTLEGSLKASGDTPNQKALQEALKKLQTLGIDGNIRNVEEACTRLATVATWVPESAWAIGHDSASVDETVRAFALVTAAIGFRRAYRRQRSREAIVALIELNVPWQDSAALNLHLESLTYSGTSPDDLKKGLKLSRQAEALCSDSPGIYHALAEFQLDNAIWNSGPEDRNPQLDEALRNVDTAIKMVKGAWPKFNFTRARILVRQGATPAQLEGALSAIDEAIEREATATVDSHDRRNTYQVERLMMEVRLVVAELDSVAKKRIQEVDEQAQQKIADLARSTQMDVALESRRSQTMAITLVAVVSGILALLSFAAALYQTAAQAAATAGGSFWYLIGAMLAVAIILMGSIAVGSWLLTRQLTKLPCDTSQPNGQKECNEASSG